MIRCYKARFFLCNKNNTDRNGVKRNTNTVTHTTHTPNTKRKITKFRKFNLYLLHKGGEEEERGGLQLCNYASKEKILK